MTWGLPLRLPATVRPYLARKHLTRTILNEVSLTMNAVFSKSRFVWHELLAADPAGSKDFYPAVVGWGTQDWKTPPGAPPYTVWMNGSTSVGGLMALPPEVKAAGAPPHWLGYVSVADVDTSLAQAKKLGAAVHFGPVDLPEVGRIAVLADPQGAAIALFTPGGAGMSPPEHPPVGAVSWNELATDDGKKAFDFYSQLFGWTKGEAMDMGAMGTYQIVAPAGGGVPFGAIYNRPPQIPVSNWLYYFRVADLDAAVDKAKAKGGKLLNGPMDVPGGRIAQLMDAQGAAFALHGTAQG